MKCKLCGIDVTNGTNFCVKEHRLIWIREHNIKGVREFYSNPENDSIHQQFGLNHSCLDKDSIGKAGEK